MNWFKFFDAKEIGTLYLIFAVFAGMIGLAFSVLLILEVSAPGAIVKIKIFILENMNNIYTLNSI
jgi:heme/copper-type cytochrome/quinol oxidase subunit 1